MQFHYKLRPRNCQEEKQKKRTASGDAAYGWGIGGFFCAGCANGDLFFLGENVWFLSEGGQNFTVSS